MLTRRRPQWTRALGLPSAVRGTDPMAPSLAVLLATRTLDGRSGPGQRKRLQQ